MQGRCDSSEELVCHIRGTYSRTAGGENHVAGRQQLPPPKRCRGWKAPRSMMPLPRGIPAASHFMFFWQIQRSVTHTPASGAPESCIADPGWKTRPSGQKKHQKPPESSAGTRGWVRGALLEERGMRAGTESHCRELQEAVGRGKGAPQRRHLDAHREPAAGCSKQPGEQLE